MKRWLLIAMLATMVGIFANTWHKEQAPLANQQESGPGEPKLVRTSKLAKTSADKQDKNPGASLVVNVEDWSQDLLVLQGRTLTKALKQFWADCTKRADCNQLLLELEPRMPASFYGLLAYYPVLERQWQERLGTMNLNQFTTLAEKVAEMKRQAELVWGAHAVKLLADEFALYEFSIESQMLSQTGSEHFFDDFQLLLERWQESENAIDVETSSAKYERGVALIPSHYTSEQRNAVKKQLASAYLNLQQIKAIAMRQQQVIEQAQAVNDYNVQLSQLEASLAEQRATRFAALSENQWQRYSQQQISVFRREFFNSQ